MALVAFNRFDPFDELWQFQDAVDRLLHNPALGWDLGLSGASVFPALNVFRTDEGVLIRAELPGVKPDQVEVTAEAGRLTISGERAQAEHGEGASYHRRERRFGRFARTVRLPEDLDLGQASAQCRNGVLTVRVPWGKAAKPRQISVTSN